MSEPFPDDHFGKSAFVIPENKTDLVYEETRYTPGMAPKCIYVPSPILMFKLMRSCINCIKDEDLWFNMEE